MVVNVRFRVEETQENAHCEFLSQIVSSHASALVGGIVIVSGGYVSRIGRLDMFYILDLKTKSWRNLPVSVSLGGTRWNSGRKRVSIGPRNYHKMLLVDDKIYVHGGGKEKRMVRLDVVTHELEDVVERLDHGVSVSMATRAGATLEFYERDRVLLTFGVDSYSSVLSYRVDLETWQKLDTKGTLPVPRRFHTSCMAGDGMYICGGKALGQDPHDLSDLLVLTIRPSPSWSTLIEHRAITKNWASLVHVRGRLLLYGGIRTGGSTVPENERLLVFNLRSNGPIQSEQVLSNETIQGKWCHTAIVRGDEILIVGVDSGGVQETSLCSS